MKYDDGTPGWENFRLGIGIAVTYVNYAVSPAIAAGLIGGP